MWLQWRNAESGFSKRCRNGTLNNGKGIQKIKIGQLKNLLKAGEWNDIEFKGTRNELPKSSFETVSGFAITHGGWLMLGVSQQGELFEVSGVLQPDKIQNDFFSVLQADKKANHDVHVTEQRMDVDGKTVLMFHIA